MKYCRINLSKTHYLELENYQLLANPDAAQLNAIYRQYCQYKQFDSVMPIFQNDYRGRDMEVLGYYNDQAELVAFSLIRRHDLLNVEAVQFAWNYQEPRLRLGICSLENECARYKRLGYRYLYLGFADEYKQKFQGFETLGPVE
jgi:arginyl-tRNA--protein-N-Asp/Glu arginylyltransferase